MRGSGGRLRATRCAGVALVLLCIPVALGVVGPGGCVGLILLVVGGAILLTEAAYRRAGSSTVTPGARAWVEPPAVASAEPVRATSSADGFAPPVGFTDEELCWAWRRSFARLVHASGPEAVARLAEQRRGYLNELERRYPARFAVWISSGARAAGDPTPFFRPHRTP